jgi:hypothetical protein
MHSIENRGVREYNSIRNYKRGIRIAAAFFVKEGSGEQSDEGEVYDEI